MELYNALDLKSGKKAEYNKMGTLTQPIQFLPTKKKDEEWAAWNLDWFEWQGLKQLRRNARRLLKNYKLANGIIDKTDYIVEEDNEYADILESLTEEDVSALELKFYPIIPNVVNTLCNEFAERNTKITYRSVDEFSYNEMLEEKRMMIEQTLVANAQQKILAKIIQSGEEIDQEQMQQQMSMENIRTLPEIEEFFRKDYRSIAEEWAQHQYEADMERFTMDELEERGFKDLLCADREFWHFKMYEDDYDMELWNPVLTFYHKSPEARYISEGNWVGKIDMMSVSDVIDKYGFLMTQDQLEALEAIYPVRSAGYPIQGYQNDGSYYDATQSHEWNTQMPSLAYRQFVSMHDGFWQNGGDIVSWILGESEDFLDFGSTHLLRVTTVYWKSQRKVGYLTKINEFGDVITEIVGEDFKVVDKPIYNTNVIKNKGPENLVFGDHVEWIWINQVWGGVKIGPNHSSYWGMNNPGGVNPMYLGINQNQIGPLKFQFKGDKTLYGCKLPVEGRIFTDRNSKSVSLVDQMKPWQIGYNIVNNQISDILVDELGTIVAFDQNGLPRHSMGEDWGKNNLAKAYVAMKDFSMMPFDSTIANTENPIAMQHLQVLNLEQTNRLMSRIQLANYFKMQAFENIGVTPQRMGQAIEQETAEGIRAAINMSYAQTEQYFIWHSDHLMPRVHKMRTDLAQYYHSTKPSVTLQYLTSNEEKVNFGINGMDLLLRDIHVYGTTKANHRKVLESLRQLAMSNNTAGASIYDLGNMIKADSIPEITDVMKKAEEKVQAQQQQEQQHQQQMQQQAIQAEQAEKQAERDYKAMESEKDRRKDILVAEIRASGYGAMMDVNQNMESDLKESLDDIRQTEQYEEQTQIKRQDQSMKSQQHADKLALEREKIDAQKEISRNQLNIARENKNKYDVQAASNENKKNKKE
jgi:hypothetical protein